MSQAAVPQSVTIPAVPEQVRAARAGEIERAVVDPSVSPSA